MFIAGTFYIAIICSFIWARLRFFRMNAGTPALGAWLYDITVAVQIFLTLYLMLKIPDRPLLLLCLCSLLYAFALGMFWWSILTAKGLDFAFSDKVGSIVTTGPFGLVRHPFYVSYILVWLSSTLLFNSVILWITLVWLATFYFLSARKEEKVIMQSVYSTEYGKYIQNVGMFLPRIIKWMQSSSRH